ncbi:Coenzyme F420 hydrogenase/dehydrogenase, beta subunit C-terminal domain [Sinomicrobium soli]|uniref:Coenzyme F420 hydrogenase/dehydrogenase, beta subunit C-terminal domain n=1 Tax=Sinomicrobium sp. N-1-3-6 TaxID=2219864 RepID=UPI000DCD8581|nr:Coenzyme F420 hydrogenase/dehydrogenase, beta subunit C-terminal domain [Sinomicrobium sp. N-1-3-6]RAV30995.1 hypothetical protein DN748_01750 [Sinomicrobium sp. N-1-3-6]
MKESRTIKDVVDNQLCTGCGLCVSESDGIRSMKWNEDGFLVPDIINVINDNSIKVCPFNPAPDEDVRDEDRLSKLFLSDSDKKDFKIGRYIGTYVGFSEQHRTSSSSGGIATYIFEQLLKNNHAQHLFIVKEVNGTYEYQLFSDFRQINKISKTRYLPVTLEKLFEIIDKLDGKIGVSGVACFIKAIRLKQHYYPELKEKIAFLVGIICGGLKSKLYTDFLVQNVGIKGDYSNQEYRIKDFYGSASGYGFGAYDAQEVLHTMKMSKVGDMWGTGLFKSNACDFCDDVTTELADISLGDAWINPYRKDGRGASIIITRSLLADELIKSGMKNGELKANLLAKEEVIRSQAASFRHRQQASKFRIDQNIRNKELTPYKRSRFFQNIPVEYKIVQKERRVVRALSIELWKKTKSLQEYNQKMDVFKRRLKKKTLIYSKIQKIRRVLKIKTL